MTGHPNTTQPQGGTSGSRAHAVVFIGGFAPHTRAHDSVIEGSLLIAADSGWEHAIASGHVPDILVGDMDSIQAIHLEQAHAAHTEVITHPADKDETDTEIALATAVARGAVRVTVIAGGGDRPDHVFAMLHSLAAPSLAGVVVDGWLGATRFVVCRAGSPAVLDTTEGDTVSLLPVGGDSIITATGLRWPLERSTLHAHESRGVSNRAIGPVRIDLHSGTLIAFITPGDPQ